jgi:hypothetical protein
LPTQHLHAHPGVLAERGIAHRSDSFRCFVSRPGRILQCADNDTHFSWRRKAKAINGARTATPVMTLS